MSVLDTATYVLDTPGALLRGLLAGKPGQRATGREALHLGPNRPGLDAGDIPGFLAEILLDPVNLIGGAGVLKGAKYLSKARKARAAAKTTTEAAKAAETMAVAAKPMIASIDPRVGEIEQGTAWLAKHYGEKMAKTKKATGRTNVINERSGLPLWEDGTKGQSDLANLARRNVDVKANPDMPIEHAAQYVPSTRTIEYNPVGTRNYETLKPTGVHEGQHYLNDRNIHPNLKLHLSRVNDAARRMWKNRGYSEPVHMRKRPDVNGTSFVDYIMNDDEVLARIAGTRQAMEEYGVKSFTPTYYRRPNMIHGTGRFLPKRSFQLSAAELDDIPLESRHNAELLMQVYGPQLVNHMLRVLPAAAVTTGGAYAAANAMSPRQAVSA